MNTIIKINLTQTKMVLNFGVSDLLGLFKNNGWTSEGVIDSKEGITYFKEGHETEYFQLRYSNISGSEEPIYVSVPLRNSTYQYVLYFKEFESATNYISKMFYEYTNTFNIDTNNPFIIRD